MTGSGVTFSEEVCVAVSQALPLSLSAVWLVDSAGRLSQSIHSLIVFVQAIVGTRTACVDLFVG